MAKKKLDLSKLQTDTSQAKSTENTSNYKKECEFGVIDGFKPMPREQLAYNSIFRLCTDKTGVLSSVEDCQRIITALEHLASIVVPDELEEKKSKSELSRDVFEDCASGSARAFFPGKMKEVAEALSTISGDLSVVRLTR